MQRKVEKVGCPICKKLFPTSDVETHASACQEFKESDESDIAEVIERTPSPTASRQCGII